MKNVAVVFFDVDGTLAAHNHGEMTSILERVPQSAVDAIKLLKAAQILPVIATGRNKGMIKELMDHLQVQNLIANNGRYVCAGDDVIYNDIFSVDSVTQISSYLKSHQIDFCYETADNLYKNVDSNFSPDSSMQIFDLGIDEIPENVLQFIVRVDDPKQPLVIDLPDVKAVKVAPTVYDITKESSNKAIGVNKFLAAKKIAPEHAVAFGDEVNDLEMFESVGTSIAMGNAVDKIKQSADHVTTSVKDDGIYRAVVKLLENN